MLPRVRAVLLRLQFEGHPDLAEVDVRKMGNYWLKVTGDSIMPDSGIPAHMVNGQCDGFPSQPVARWAVP